LQLTANALANHLGTILASFLGCFSAPRWPLAAAEWVPSELNPNLSLQDLFAGIAKTYPTSSETVVAIHANRVETIDFPTLEIPELPVAQLWVFGSTRDDQSEWVIVGDLLGEPRQHVFRYPWP
jgi:hypothetical protein